MKKVSILETTLRDGSYAVNFSFSSSDTSIICKELEDAGFKYIEIGHGVGLNATNRGYGDAAQTDEEYMIAAESVLKKAKYGMFCIPGIARLEDIDLAAKHHMGFIRVGTNATEVPNSEPYIKRAKDHGMFVTANFMKSYILPPHKFAEQVKLSEKYGADLMLKADLAIGAAGTTIWERCCLGLPCLIITLSNNQKEIANFLDKRGCCVNLGWFEDVETEDIRDCLDNLLKNLTRLNEMSRKSMKLVDGLGANRVADILSSV